MTSVVLLYCSCSTYRYDLFIYLFIGVPNLLLHDTLYLYDQDIEVGKAVRPQLAMRVRDASAAWKKVFPQRSFALFFFDLLLLLHKL